MCLCVECNECEEGFVGEVFVDYYEIVFCSFVVVLFDFVVK